MSMFAAAFIALYVGHHVGDYWVQRDVDAKHKGAAGWLGRFACLSHVFSYLLTQYVMLLVMLAALGQVRSVERYLGWVAAALAVSGATHYLADRREHGLMFWLARRIPGKANFMKLGVPREPRVIELWGPCPDCYGRGSGGPASDESSNGMCWTCQAGGQLPMHVTVDDNPSLGTGTWALDQSWHVALGCFVPALIIAAGAA